MLTGNRTGVGLTVQPLHEVSLNFKALDFVQRLGHMKPKMASPLTGFDHGSPVFFRDLPSHVGRKIVEKDQGPGFISVGTEIDIGTSRVLRAKPGKTCLDLGWIEIFGLGRARRKKGCFFAAWPAPLNGKIEVGDLRLAQPFDQFHELGFWLLSTHGGAWFMMMIHPTIRSIMPGAPKSSKKGPKYRALGALDVFAIDCTSGHRGVIVLAGLPQRFTVNVYGDAMMTQAVQKGVDEVFAPEEFVPFFEGQVRSDHR